MKRKKKKKNLHVRYSDSAFSPLRLDFSQLKYQPPPTPNPQSSTRSTPRGTFGPPAPARAMLALPIVRTQTIIFMNGDFSGITTGKSISISWEGMGQVRVHGYFDVSACHSYTFRFCVHVCVAFHPLSAVCSLCGKSEDRSQSSRSRCSLAFFKEWGYREEVESLEMEHLE